DHRLGRSQVQGRRHEPLGRLGDGHRDVLSRSMVPLRVSAFAVVLSIASVARAEPAPPVPDKSADKRAEPAPSPAGSEVTLLPTFILAGTETPPGTRPNARESAFVGKAHQLDLVLSDALQDFGLTLDL